MSYSMVSEEVLKRHEHYHLFLHYFSFVIHSLSAYQYDLLFTWKEFLFGFRNFLVFTNKKFSSWLQFCNLKWSIPLVLCPFFPLWGRHCIFLSTSFQFSTRLQERLVQNALASLIYYSFLISFVLARYANFVYIVAFAIRDIFF